MPQISPGENIVITGILLVVLGFFIKAWMKGIKDSLNEIKLKLDKKVDIATCDRVHRVVDRLAHTHGTAGSSGEMIEQQGRKS